MRVMNVVPKQQENNSVDPSPKCSGVNHNAVSEDAMKKEPGHFNRWWREYQQKLKASLAGTSLKLQVEGLMMKGNRVVRYHRRLRQWPFSQ